VDHQGESDQGKACSEEAHVDGHAEAMVLDASATIAAAPVQDSPEGSKGETVAHNVADAGTAVSDSETAQTGKEQDHSESDVDQPPPKKVYI